LEEESLVWNFKARHEAEELDEFLVVNGATSELLDLHEKR